MWTRHIRFFFLLFCLVASPCTLYAQTQLSQLIYLKTFPKDVFYGSSHFKSLNNGEYYILQVAALNPYDASIWPNSDDYLINPELFNNIIIYDTNLNPIGEFECNAVTRVVNPIYFNGTKFIFQVWQNFSAANAFESVPELTGAYPPTIYGGNYTLEFDIDNNILRMPFNCSCPFPNGENNVHAPFPQFATMTDLVFGSINSAVPTSDGRLITTLGIFDDFIVNWSDSATIGLNYWNTVWIKSDPLSGNFLSTDLLSEYGSAITTDLFKSHSEAKLYRAGIVTGNEVPMSPDGTVWNPQIPDTSFSAYFLKENENGEQDWMTALYSYVNVNFEPQDGPNIGMKRRNYSTVELDNNTYLSYSYRISVNPSDSLWFKDVFGNEDTLSLPPDYVPNNPYLQNVKSAHNILKFNSEGLAIAQLSIPLRNPDNLTSESVWAQPRILLSKGNNLGWVQDYSNVTDSIIYFQRNFSDGNMDSIPVSLPAGNGVYIAWLDGNFNLITTQIIPYSTPNGTNSKRIQLNSASIYHQDTLLISGTIDGGVTTRMDPSGAADEIYYETDITFLAFYTLPDILTHLPMEALPVEPHLFNVYPNPGKGSFMVITHTAETIASWAVYSISGKCVAYKNLEFRKPFIRISLQVKPGIYFLKLVTNNGTVETRKIEVLN